VDRRHRASTNIKLRTKLNNVGGVSVYLAYRITRRQISEEDMAITLDHTIVPAHHKEASARFFAEIFGLAYDGPSGHFAPVRVNEGLVMDFDEWDKFESHHYAFKVSEGEFDAIFGRVKARGIPYGSGPATSEDMSINTRKGGRGVYFKDPNGHLLELLTR
jgi:catechol 2,3-dioxygenase-like lactoylglutathione lyase family enzyme